MAAVELLRRPAADPQQRAAILDSMESSARRGADLVRQVLLVARGAEGERVKISLGPLVKEIDKMIGHTFPKSVETRTAVVKDLWPVAGDATQLIQVLMNLCVNARDAMPEGGRLTIAAKNLVLDEEYARGNPEAKPGPYVTLEVEDTGTGIAADVADKIFDPACAPSP